MSYVFVTHYKSNKAPTFQEFDASSMEAAKAQAERIMNGSVDVSDVSVYEFLSIASKVEMVQWS